MVSANVMLAVVSSPSRIIMLQHAPALGLDHVMLLRGATALALLLEPPSKPMRRSSCTSMGSRLDLAPSTSLDDYKCVAWPVFVVFSLEHATQQVERCIV